MLSESPSKNYKLLRIQFLLLLLISSATHVIGQNLEWVKTIGSNPNERAHDITTDNNGNIWITGIFRNATDFDPGPGVYIINPNFYAFYICKLDSAGNFILAKALIGSTGNFSEAPKKILTDASGNVFICGVFQGIMDFDPDTTVSYNLSGVFKDNFIAKYTSSGDLLWVKKIGGAMDDDLITFTLDAAGNIYATGRFRDSVDFDPGPGVQTLTSAGMMDIFISKMNATGDLIWAKRIGGPQFDYGIDICLSPTDDILVCGSYQDSVDFDPDPGQTSYGVGSGIDMFVIKLDPSGNFSWVKSIGGPGSEIAQSIKTDAGGDIFFSGNFTGTVDFDPGPSVSYLTQPGINVGGVMMKMDSGGNYIWAKGITGNNYSTCKTASLDASGNVYVTGVFKDTVDFDPGPGITQRVASGLSDFYALKLDSSGNYQWLMTGGGSQAFCTIISSIYDLQSNSLLIAGEYSDTMNMSIASSPALISAGAADAIVAKINFGTVGLNETSRNPNGMAVFPNPTSGLIQLYLQHPAPTTEVIILNSIGQVISKNIFSATAKIVLSIEDAPGLYFLKVVNGDEVKILKVMKQ